MLDGVIWLLRKIAHNCVLSCPLSCTKMAEDNARKRSLGEEGGEDEGMAKRAATGAATGDVSSGVQAFMLKVLCPRDSVGNIIGQGGSVIRDLNLTTGARIKVSQNNEHFPTTNDRIILISGCKEKINAALSEIITKIIQVCKNNYCVCCCCSYSHSFSLNSFPLTKSLLFVPFPFPPHSHSRPIPTIYSPLDHITPFHDDNIIIIIINIIIRYYFYSFIHSSIHDQRHIRPLRLVLKIPTGIIISVLLPVYHYPTRIPPRMISIFIRSVIVLRTSHATPPIRGQIDSLADTNTSMQMTTHTHGVGVVVSLLLHPSYLSIILSQFPFLQTFFNFPHRPSFLLTHPFEQWFIRVPSKNPLQVLLTLMMIQPLPLLQ